MIRFYIEAVIFKAVQLHWSVNLQNMAVSVFFTFAYAYCCYSIYTVDDDEDVAGGNLKPWILESDELPK